jgi:hypothetical protein
MTTVFVPYAVPDHEPGKLFRVVEAWVVILRYGEDMIINPGDSFMILAVEQQHVELPGDRCIRFTCLGNNGVVWYLWYSPEIVKRGKPFYNTPFVRTFAVPL